jgi:DNA-binding Lrp family transcriptional regulator
MNSNFQERIIAILHGSPNGLTSSEIAARLGATAGNISSRLSKLAAYGIIGRYKGNVYRALTGEQASVWSQALKPNSRSTPSLSVSTRSPLTPEFRGAQHSARARWK